MSQIKREWLVNGCLNFENIQEEDRISIRIRNILSNEYGEKFNIRSWPQRNYKRILWWHEETKIPGKFASYFLEIDNKKGPNLYVGISIEKGLEDQKTAEIKARDKGVPTENLLLQEDWDWYKFLSTIDLSWPIIFNCAKSLDSELYFSIEFHGEQNESRYYKSRYYTIYDDKIFWRGGFKSINPEEIFQFITKPFPKLWGNVYLAKAFSVNDCAPHLEETKILEVLTAMRPIRDLWRGISRIN